MGLLFHNSKYRHAAPSFFCQKLALFHASSSFLTTMIEGGPSTRTNSADYLNLFKVARMENGMNPPCY